MQPEAANRRRCPGSSAVRVVPQWLLGATLGFCAALALGLGGDRFSRGSGGLPSLPAAPAASVLAPIVPVFPPPLEPPLPAAAAAAAAADAAAAIAAYPYLRGARWSATEALALAAADARALPAGAAAECLGWLSSASRVASFTAQYGQDATIYYSFLAGKLARGERGVYVDIGANDARRFSNTWFLDRCLGWTGICFEADPDLAAKLRASERSCRVVNACANGVAGELPYVRNTPKQPYSGHIAREGETADAAVACAPLSELLRAEGLARVDFLSIDIEGNEIRAMSNTDWDAVPVELVLVESAWSNEQLDMLLHDGGYWRASDISYIDDLYVRAPRLLHGAMQTPGRVENWRHLLAEEKRKGRCVKREAGIGQQGDSVVYTGGEGSIAD